ncbi:tRNA(Met) cytidine acetyltransferase TmcA [Thiomicrorhabdus chilensis]|uniref:tRNA(Met) cytidine acetyltransferase TmcA n=1 Tax=Thiomicrorhabdus chilensis TaxID=63656 RepID=UPI000409277B|nr:GNAT family N-acetyltransferase [Thiomicrorhabdus chilensis]
MTPSALTELRSQLKTRRHRALTILCGEPSWQNQQLDQLWQADERVLMLGNANDFPALSDMEVESIPGSKIVHLLGQEADGVIIDVRQGLSANSLGIASGLLRAGGLLILLTPELEQWRTLPNPENARFLNSPYQIEQARPYFTEHLINSWQTQTHPFIVWRHQHQPQNDTLTNVLHHLSQPQQSTPPQTADSAFSSNHTPFDDLTTSDQLKAIKAIDTVAFGHRKRPLVVHADRGRGKSSLLGMAAIDCLVKGKKFIAVTASRPDQAAMVFKQALNSLEKISNIDILTQKPNLIRFTLNSEIKTLEFIAPDELVVEPTHADLLMVDEAAHLPTPLLLQLLHRHHRMVFATTLHGYEGSGRGFELRFKKSLDRLTPDWKQVHLKQPIRWAEDDPLEASINHALLLETDASQPVDRSEPLPFDPAAITIEPLTTQQLAQQPGLLKSVFELLVQAHYQTSPNDLQQLLSAPNLKVIIARQAQNVIGVLLAVEEGKIMPNSPRVHGHLVPQLLEKHYAQPNFLMLASWRVMRITVYPRYQRYGIGKQLLTQLKTQARQSRIDYLSSSFGASEELLPFWFDLGYRPVHVGVKRDKASGSYNLVVGQALSAMAQQALAKIQSRFQAQFPHTLMESLPYLSAPMILAILQTFRFKTQKPQLEQELIEYLHGKRVYESLSGQLWEWSIRTPQAIKKMSSAQQCIWCDKVLKKHSWQTVAHNHHLPGRKGVENALKDALEPHFSNAIKKPASLKSGGGFL